MLAKIRELTAGEQNKLDHQIECMKKLKYTHSEIILFKDGVRFMRRISEGI